MTSRHELMKRTPEQTAITGALPVNEPQAIGMVIIARWPPENNLDI